MTVCPSGQGDGLEIHWALPAGVRIPSLSCLGSFVTNVRARQYRLASLAGMSVRTITPLFVLQTITKSTARGLEPLRAEHVFDRTLVRRVSCCGLLQHPGHMVCWYHTRSACGRPWVQPLVRPLINLCVWRCASPPSSTAEWPKPVGTRSLVPLMSQVRHRGWLVWCSATVCGARAGKPSWHLRI